MVQWLKNLMWFGVIPEGHVDDRDIQDVRPEDLEGFTQCHFFAGIGGWAYALGLAGWPRDWPVWTGSCPCQPYSAAAHNKKEDQDERNLFPFWRPLIAKHRPAVVFGEQVASKAGRVWLSRVRTQMEELDYAIGSGDFCSAGVSAPDLRQRLYFAAHQPDFGSQAGAYRTARDQGGSPQGRAAGSEHGRSNGGLGDARHRQQGRPDTRPGKDFKKKRCGSSNEPCAPSGPDRMADADGSRRKRQEVPEGQGRSQQAEADVAGHCGGLGNAGGLGLQGQFGHGFRGGEPGWYTEEENRSASKAGQLSCTGSLANTAGEECRSGAEEHEKLFKILGDPREPNNPYGSGRLHRFWGQFNIVPCIDGKIRRVEPGSFPLAYGIPRSLGRCEPGLRDVAKRARANRKGRIRGYGNAINPILAAEFIKVFMEYMEEFFLKNE